MNVCTHFSSMVILGVHVRPLGKNTYVNFTHMGIPSMYIDGLEIVIVHQSGRLF